MTSLLFEGFQAGLNLETGVEDAPIFVDSWAPLPLVRRLEILLAHHPLHQFVCLFPNVRQLLLREVYDIFNKPVSYVCWQSLDLVKAKVADVITCPIKCAVYHLDLDDTTDAESKAMAL